MLNTIKQLAVKIDLIIILGVIFLVPLLPFTKTDKLIWGAVFIYIIKRLITKEPMYKYNKLDLYIVIMLFVFWASSVFSKNMELSMKDMYEYITAIMFGLICRNTINSEKLIKTGIHVINISVLGVSVYGFYQAFVLKPIQASWLDPNARNDITFRIYSTLDNPNLLAIFMSMIIPLMLFMILYEKNILSKIYFVISLLISLMCLGLTFSRTGMIGILASILLVIFLVNKKYILYLLGIITVSIPFLPAVFVNRVKSIGITDSTITYRFKIWETTGDMIRDNFVKGIGFGSSNYYEVYKNYLGRTKQVAHAHNTFLDIFVQSGIVGILVFLLFIFKTFQYYLQEISNSNDKFKKLFLITSLAVIFGFLVNGLAENSFYYYKNTIMFYIILFISSGMFSDKIKTRKDDAYEN